MFEVSPDAYGRFMGRYSWPLAPLFLDAVADERAGLGAKFDALLDVWRKKPRGLQR